MIKRYFDGMIGRSSEEILIIGTHSFNWFPMCSERINQWPIWSTPSLSIIKPIINKKKNDIDYNSCYYLNSSICSGREKVTRARSNTHGDNSIFISRESNTLKLIKWLVIKNDLFYSLSFCNNNTSPLSKWWGSGISREVALGTCWSSDSMAGAFIVPLKCLLLKDTGSTFNNGRFN